MVKKKSNKDHLKNPGPRIAHSLECLLAEDNLHFPLHPFNFVGYTPPTFTSAKRSLNVHSPAYYKRDLIRSSVSQNWVNVGMVPEAL
ncbi:hypothetical protein CDAR_476061 [Caerostris darwini]|uniref:Uncharacterized protein n=1 Tax=Caerostris darwini TaxID=1538125 RepID=A0AAV4PBT1_9ARAC|nr:hypothetical protein CDAR_476061 [Caerostris darwini]